MVGTKKRSLPAPAESAYHYSGWITLDTGSHHACRWLILVRAESRRIMRNHDGLARTTSLMLAGASVFDMD